MYYIDQQQLPPPLPSSQPHKTTISLLLTTLTIPPKQRTLNDHEFVYRFFYGNKILGEIQRVKSVNARMLCVAELVVGHGHGGKKDNINNKDGSKKDKDENENENEDMILIDTIVIPPQPQPQPQPNPHSPKKPPKKPLPPQTHQILLPTPIYNKILSSDEKYLRTNIQKLKKYIIIQNMKYTQLLHLAYYMDQVQYKYKEIVYREGQAADFLYLVEIGEFHYSRIGEVGDLGKRRGKKEGEKKDKDRPKRYDAKLDNPNRLKNSKSIQYKIGLIQGQSNQCFGQQQILAQKPRKFTIRCMTTQNLVLRIPSDKYRRVVCTSPAKIQELRQENLRKLELKDQMFDKMRTVKSNYRKYVEMIGMKGSGEKGEREGDRDRERVGELNRTEIVRSGGSGIGMREDGMSRTQIHNSIHVSGHVENYASMLPRIKSQSMASDEYRFNRQKSKTRNNSQLEISQQNLQNPKKSYQSEQSQPDNTFALTKAHSKNRPHPHPHPGPTSGSGNNSRQNITSLHVSTTGSHATILPTLPTLGSEKYKASSTYQTIEEKSSVSKNWSATRPIVELRGLRNKFSGMIDVSSLVKQKQQILNIKMMGKEADKQIYPINLNPNTNTSKKSQKPLVSILTKQQTRQMRSAVHSKAFMQKLLVQALKKAGYNAQKATQNESYTNDTPNSVVDVKNNLRLPKSRVKIERDRERERDRDRERNGSSLLHQNQFDQCYFRKIQ